MTAESSDFVLPFGKFRGECLEKVPLWYLDWLVEQTWLRDPAKAAIEMYLSDGDLSKPLQKMQQIIIEALTARGMTVGESKAFIHRLCSTYKSSKGG